MPMLSIIGIAPAKYLFIAILFAYTARATAAAAGTVFVFPVNFPNSPYCISYDA